MTLGSSLDRVLHQLAESARDLVGARYAAIGLPEAEGDEFARFVTVGMSDELIEQLGPLPRTHGLLDAMLTDPSPFRTADITQDPRWGWWPAAHPQMRSFLGVPIVSAGDIIGAFYLTDKRGEPEFSAADESAVVLLAPHAAIAIDQARLFEDSRELGLAQERGRLARELHDSMSQSLFSLQLSAEAAGRLLESHPPPPPSRWPPCGRSPAASPSCGPRSTACGPPTSSATDSSPRSTPSCRWPGERGTYRSRSTPVSCPSSKPTTSTRSSGSRRKRSATPSATPTRAGCGCSSAPSAARTPRPRLVGAWPTTAAASTRPLGPCGRRLGLTSMNERGLHGRIAHDHVGPEPGHHRRAAGAASWAEPVVTIRHMTAQLQPE